ncbi:Pkinase-domain-containing protein [Hesseltinella vesiculosa]|uniref:Pkinase-domain-containing protein n=1 Tax=Hesseltinella vesiculosa TaxID=101127 RepID=A0A1X2G4E4_9FUNG|nr:Pkinase-domain-containing protein [Hesseltinella vesiculosa]
MQQKELTTSAKYLMHHRLDSAFSAKYVLREELGSGGFGFVLAANERKSGREVAVKFIFRDKVPYHAWVRTEQGVLPMEIYVLKYVQHPNIIGYIDHFEDATFFYLVMELHGTQWGPNQPCVPDQPAYNVDAGTSTPPPTSTLPPLSPSLSEDSWTSEDDDYPQRFTRRTSCDLFECIEKHRSFDEPLAKHIFKQIVECIAHLDKLGIYHRDVKDENIVIDDQLRVKLIDFGSAVILPRHYGEPKKTFLFEQFYGTFSFASPEILMKKLYRAEPAEIWSLGVLLYTILFGEIPFVNAQAAIAGQCVPPKKKVSSKCFHLLSCLLQRHPDHRPTIHQVLTHPWLQDN